MAVSPNFTTSNQFVWYWLQVDLTSQDIALNHSYIRVRIWAQRTAGYETYGSGTATFYNYTGKQYTATIYPSQKITSTPVCLFDQNHYVNHDAAGNASPSFGAAINIPSILSSSAQYHTFPLPQIQRAAAITSVSAGESFGSQITVNWSGNAAYTYRVLITGGDSQEVITTTAGASSASYTPPLDWLTNWPNSASTGVSIELKTLYNGSQIGASSWYSLYQSVPASVVPTVTATLSHVDIFPARPVPTGWGYVQTRSGVKVDVTAAGAYGSTITSMTIGGGGYANAAVTVTDGTGSRTFGALNEAGTNSFTIIVGDSRGRYAAIAVGATVNAYSRPQLSGILTQRATSGGVQDSNGTYALGKATYTFSAVGSNAVVRHVGYRELGATTWTDASVSFNSGVPFLIGGGFNVLKSYEIAYVVEDQFNTVIYTDILSVATPILHFKKGGLMAAIFKRVGSFIGLDIGADVNIDGDLSVTGVITGCCYAVGDIYITVNPANPSTKWAGTTWVAFGAGRVLIGMGSNGTTNYTTVGATGGEDFHVLSVGELPAHRHNILITAASGTPGYMPVAPLSDWGPTPIETQDSGSNWGHENRSSYITVYMWKRTA